MCAEDILSIVLRYQAHLLFAYYHLSLESTSESKRFRSIVLLSMAKANFHLIVCYDLSTCEITMESHLKYTISKDTLQKRVAIASISTEYAQCILFYFISIHFIFAMGKCNDYDGSLDGNTWKTYLLEQKINKIKLDGKIL